MPLFHSTLSLGRSDSIVTENTSATSLLNFLKIHSKAVVRNIKEIVFSKDYNINYTSVPFLQGDIYDKVIIQALSSSFSETYILFNIKRTVTKEDIQKEFKKLLINNEPIIDFMSITFYDKGVSPTNYNNLYQVQYKRNSKTYTENFYSKKWEDVLSIATALIDGEITEIRKFVHFDSTVKKDDGIGYYKAVTASLSSDDAYRTLKIPKVIHGISHDELTNNIADTFKVYGKDINKDDLLLKYS
jgi:hypothetical protein